MKRGIDRDAEIHARILEDVRRAAERCRDDDLREGHDERAIRQYAIVTRQCIEDRPLAEVAATLAISHAHCYRERSAICRRVARLIADSADSPVMEPLPTLDEFRFLTDQTMHRAEFTDADTVLRDCEKLICSAPGAQEKIEALRVSVSVCAYFGDWARMESARAAAQRIWTDDLQDRPSSAREIASACIDLIGLEVAHTLGDVPSMVRNAESATKHLEPFLAQAPMRIRELYAESRLNLGLALGNLSGFEEGFDHVAQADAMLDRIRPVSSQLRTWAMVEVWRGRNRLLMNSRHWLPAWQREEGLTRAFHYAYSSGAYAGAIRALVALSEHHAFAENDEDALRAARCAVSLAKKHPSSRVFGQTSVSAVLPLLSTQYWMEGTALLPTSAELDAMDTYRRLAFSYCMAVRALRSGKFQDALRLASAGSGNYPGFGVRMRLIAAAAAHALERRRDAQRLIEEGVAVAEEHRSAPILKDAYSIASRIVPNGRFKGQARELSRLLTA